MSFSLRVPLIFCSILSTGIHFLAYLGVLNKFSLLEVPLEFPAKLVSFSFCFLFVS
jgi:hypothetical protein